jgi:hypothetical protein
VAVDIKTTTEWKYRHVMGRHLPSSKRRAVTAEPPSFQTLRDAEVRFAHLAEHDHRLFFPRILFLTSSSPPLLPPQTSPLITICSILELLLFSLLLPVI